MECNFVVGQKVVCVDASHTNSDATPELEAGQVYQIAWVGIFDTSFLSPSKYSQEAIYVRLRGVREAWDTPFAARRFRPLVSRPTDISIFTEILNTPRKPIPDTHERSPDPVEVPLC